MNGTNVESGLKIGIGFQLVGVPDGTMIGTNRVYPVGQAGEGLRANSRARIRSTTERDGGCVVISGTRGVMSRYAARCRKIVK